MSTHKGLSRRTILGTGLVGGVSAMALAACGETTVIEREVIKEVPVERIVTVEKEVPVEVVREVIKEVPAEVSGIGSNVSAKIVVFDFGGEADAKIYSDAHRRFNKRYPNVEVVDNFTPSAPGRSTQTRSPPRSPADPSSISSTLPLRAPGLSSARACLSPSTI